MLRARRCRLRTRRVPIGVRDCQRRPRRRPLRRWYFRPRRNSAAPTGVATTTTLARASHNRTDAIAIIRSIPFRACRVCGAGRFGAPVTSSARTDAGGCVCLSQPGSRGRCASRRGAVRGRTRADAAPARCPRLKLACAPARWTPPLRVVNQAETRAAARAIGVIQSCGAVMPKADFQGSANQCAHVGWRRRLPRHCSRRGMIIRGDRSAGLAGKCGEKRIGAAFFAVHGSRPADGRMRQHVDADLVGAHGLGAGTAQQVACAKTQASSRVETGGRAQATAMRVRWTGGGDRRFRR